MSYKIIIIVWLLSIIVNAEVYELRFRPFGEVIYSFELWDGDKKMGIPSPQIYKTGTIHNQNKFTISAYSICSVSPPFHSDINAGWGRIEITSNGNTYSWERLNFNWNSLYSPFPEHMPLDGWLLTDYPILFPYFNKNKFKIGETWSIKLPAPIIFTSDINSGFIEKMKASFNSGTKANHKFEQVANMLGFKCAEISYNISDSMKLQNGKTLRFLCSGKLYFAIKEGFIVYEMMEIEHEKLLRGGEISKMQIKRKLRMLDYTPFDKQN